jgi:monovalent cation:proton antiporter-2 (CPA2) family protein
MEQGFMQQALIYMAAAVIAVPVFKRLGLGAVLGFLVAGMAIGPWGFKVIEDPQTVLTFAEFGVVLLMFLVGLELNPERLWEMRKPILGMGAVQVVVTILVIAVVGWGLGYGFTVALVAGMGFAMSSTAIALATLEEKNLLSTTGGRSSFSVLLFQDLAVIPLMLVLAMMAPEKGTEGFDWMAAAKAVGMIVALIFAGRFLLRPLLRWIATAGLREIFIAFSLLLVVGIAELMHMVGLSMALGAFLAGVMLADSEYRHELELDIEPFKGLLLGLFFIAVGMSVDVGLFARVPLLIIGLAMLVIALKIAVLYAVSYLFGYCGKADATLFALALSQVGEFAFVLFGVAGTQKVVPAETVSLLNAVVAVTMLSTPFLMMLWERVLAPRLSKGAERAPDAIDEQNPVIVAGFGRFGQVVSRVLTGLGIGVTIIEHDPNQIETVRRFGWKAYYGDATRLDLLESAGAAKAKLFVVAIDDPESALEAVRVAKEHFPGLKILARARSRTDAVDYLKMDIPAVRETFAGGLDAAEAAMRMLGRGAYDARRIALSFKHHDEDLLVRVAAHRGDEARIVELAKQARADLEVLLSSEAKRSASSFNKTAPG